MRYFFNLAGAIYDPDNDGIECATVSDARIQAVLSAAELLRDRPELVWTGDEIRVEVTNKDHLLLFTVIALGVIAPAAKHLS